MAVRGSFKKRQKEGERREKRQLKLDRRQGKAPARVSLNSDAPSDVDDSTALLPEGAETETAAQTPVLPSE